MSDIVSNGLEGELSIDQALNTGVAKSVGSWLMYLYASFLEILCNTGRNRAFANRGTRRQGTKEKTTIGGFRSPLLDVLDDGLGDNAGQRVSGAVPRFSSR